jgi:hypothetical protein
MSTEYYNPWLRLFEVTEPDNPTVPVVELARDIARAQTTYPLYRAQFPDKASSIDAEYHRNLMSLRSELEKEIAARLLSDIRRRGSDGSEYLANPELPYAPDLPVGTGIRTVLQDGAYGAMALIGRSKQPLHGNPARINCDGFIRAAAEGGSPTGLLVACESILSDSSAMKSCSASAAPKRHSRSAIFSNSVHPPSPRTRRRPYVGTGAPRNGTTSNHSSGWPL